MCAHQTTTFSSACFVIVGLQVCHVVFLRRPGCKVTITIDNAVVKQISVLLRTAGSHTLASGPLRLFVFFGSPLVFLMAQSELHPDFFMSSTGTFAEPRVTDYISNSRPESRCLMQQHGDQVLETLLNSMVRLVCLMRLPEGARLAGHKAAVVSILGVGHIERRISTVQDEHDDADGEQINLRALVRLTFVDFGCHVADSSDASVGIASAVPTCHSGGESHVNYLDVVLTVKQDVTALKIAMGEPLCVHMEDSCQQLLHVESYDFRVEGA